MVNGIVHDKWHFFSGLRVAYLCFHCVCGIGRCNDCTGIKKQKKKNQPQTHIQAWVLNHKGSAQNQATTSGSFLQKLSIPSHKNTFFIYICVWSSFVFVMGHCRGCDPSRNAVEAVWSEADRRKTWGMLNYWVNVELLCAWLRIWHKWLLQTLLSILFLCLILVMII